MKYEHVSNAKHDLVTKKQGKFRLIKNGTQAMRSITEKQANKPSLD
ncbi:hypothetical protein [Companilactobacillus sp.]|nr:hypothetical protein [Companilactobacillus sp.]